jgi:hypothetical protein
VLVAGTVGNNTNQGSVRPEILRLGPGGRVDTSFGDNGIALGAVGATFEALTVDPQGRVVVAGILTGKDANGNSIEKAMIERLTGTPAPLLSPSPGRSVKAKALARTLASELEARGHCDSIAWLRRHHVCTLTLSAPESASVRASWRVPVDHRRGKVITVTWVTIATGHTTLKAHIRDSLKMSLTRAGIALLRGRRHKLRVTATDTLLTTQHTTASSSIAFWLKAP